MRTRPALTDDDQYSTETDFEFALHDVGDRLSAADGERDRTPCSSACVGLAARTVSSGPQTFTILNRSAQAPNFYHSRK